MMPLELVGVHTHERNKETNQMMLVGKAPYARFVMKGEAPICIQRGRFYTDGGDKVADKDVPVWVRKQLEGMTSEALANIGLSGEPEPEPGPSIGPKEKSEVPDGALMKALQDLDIADDAHWTKKGLPNLNVLTEYTGRRVTRKEAEAASPGFVRPT